VVLKMKIEFFHDVICSFCFPMSYRMRQVQKKYPNIEIIHRSFALAWEEEDLNKMFGNRDNAKKEILGHWEHANQNDDLHRFNIEGMKQAVLDADLNWDEFEKVFHSDEALEAVNEDLKLAYRYGIQGAPFLVINEKYGINGAQPIQVIEETIEKIAVEIHEPLTLIEDGQSCSLDENGTWTCD
jgi:predicted DsbA family dithiol-disulfide isomerase